jgi:hypothetical protein
LAKKQQLAEWQTFDQNIDFVMVEKQDLTVNNWDTPSLSTTWWQQIMTWMGVTNTPATITFLFGFETDRFPKGLVDDLLNIIIIVKLPFRYTHGGDACSGVIV